MEKELTAEEFLRSKGYRESWIIWDLSVKLLNEFSSQQNKQRFLNLVDGKDETFFSDLRDNSQQGGETVEFSEKGKNWNGEELTEDNLLSNVLVLWNDCLYKTGNRYHRNVELCDSEGEFIRQTDIREIRLVHNTSQQGGKTSELEANQITVSDEEIKRGFDVRVDNPIRNQSEDQEKRFFNPK